MVMKVINAIKVSKYLALLLTVNIDYKYMKLIKLASHFKHNKLPKIMILFPSFFTELIGCQPADVIEQQKALFLLNSTHSFPSKSFKDAVRPFVTSMPRTKQR